MSSSSRPTPRDFFSRLAGGLRLKCLSVIIDDGCGANDRRIVSEAVSEMTTAKS